MKCDLQHQMRSFLIFVLFGTIQASLISSFLNNRLNNAVEASFCVNPTYLAEGSVCSYYSESSLCQENLQCVTSMGITPYTCKSITTSTRCNLNSDCGDLFCIDHYCSYQRFPSEACSYDGMCLSNQCNNSKCAAKSVGTECTGSDCAAGSFCLASIPGGSKGVCTAQYGPNKLCGNALNSAAMTGYPLDLASACSGGYVCNVQVNASEHLYTGTCILPFSIPSGSNSVGYLGAVTCDAGLYDVSTGDYTFQCSSSSTCDNQNSCQSVLFTSCQCSTNGANGGKCASDGCVNETVAAFKCVAGTTFGVASETALADPSSSVFSACGSLYAKAQCCVAQLNQTKYFVPDGLCSFKNFSTTGHKLTTSGQSITTGHSSTTGYSMTTGASAVSNITCTNSSSCPEYSICKSGYCVCNVGYIVENNKCVPYGIISNSPLLFSTLVFLLSFIVALFI